MIASGYQSQQQLKISDHSQLQREGDSRGSTQVGTGTSQCKWTYEEKTSWQTSYEQTPAGQTDGAGAIINRGMPISFPGYGVPGNTLYLEDLQSFHQMVGQSLFTAYDALEAADDDLCQALDGLIGQVDALVTSTTTVVRQHSLLAHRILNEVMPHFKFATEAEARAESSRMVALQMLTYRMKNDAKVARASYLDVLENVQYLASCTQLALDLFECSEDPSGLPGYPYAPDRLKCAIKELCQVMRILADPSDFWLVFHVTELELGRIEDCMQYYFAKMTPQSVYAVCQALEQLCLQYLMPRA